MFEWDDLRYFAAAVRAGSFTSAAKHLYVDSATVGRRVARLETAFKGTLFIRAKGGLELTALGQRLFIATEEVESAIETAESAGRGDLAAGCVRISVPEIFGTEIIASGIPQLWKAKRNLSLELIPTNITLSASKREVDVAVSTVVFDNTRLLHEHIADYELGLFASEEYLRAVGDIGSIEDLKGCDWIGYVDDLVAEPTRRYLDEITFGIRPVLASSSMRGQAIFIQEGCGIGVLPVWIGGDLVRIFPNEIKFIRQLWMSSHQDVAHTARVKLVRSWLKTIALAAQDRLMPTASSITVSGKNPPHFQAVGSW